MHVFVSALQTAVNVMSWIGTASGHEECLSINVNKFTDVCCDPFPNIAGSDKINGFVSTGMSDVMQSLKLGMTKLP